MATKKAHTEKPQKRLQPPKAPKPEPTTADKHQLLLLLLRLLLLLLLALLVLLLLLPLLPLLCNAWLRALWCARPVPSVSFPPLPHVRSRATPEAAANNCHQ